MTSIRKQSPYLTTLLAHSTKPSSSFRVTRLLPERHSGHLSKVTKAMVVITILRYRY
jgi:hypothetical protein